MKWFWNESKFWIFIYVMLIVFPILNLVDTGHWTWFQSVSVVLGVIGVVKYFFWLRRARKT